MKNKTDTREKEQKVLFSSKKFHEYETFYRDITHYASVNIWIVNEEGHCVYLNDNWYKFTGQTKGAGLGYGWLDAVHPDDRDEVYNNATLHFNKKKPMQLQYRLLDKNNEFHWHEAIGEPKFDEQGKFTGYVGIIKDIHKQKIHEEALQKSKSWYETYAEAMPQMAFIADPKGNIIYYNKRWYEYVNDADKTTGWGWKEHPVHHPDDLDRTLERWKYSLKTGKNYEIEYRLRRYDGKYYWHLGRARPICDEEGKIKLWLGTNTNIHKQKIAEQRLKKTNIRLINQNTKLKQMRQLRENLLHIIGHDLRGPVGNMQLALELHSSLTDEKGKGEILDGLRKMVEKQKKVIDGLGELISVQNPKDVQVKEIQLKEVLMDVVHEHEFELAEAGSVDFSFEEVKTVKYVPGFLFSILKNLVSNAIKYRQSSQPLQLHVESRKQKGFVVISVSDNGIGMDLKTHGDELFQVFHRLTDKADGSGIGLYIVKNLVEGNGGKIKVESEPDKGTTFHCYLKEYR